MTQEALQHIREGDGAGYERMYTGYAKKFFNYGRKFTNNIPLIEDSIQEVFLDIWHKRSHLPPIESINSYLFSAFRYTLLRKMKGSDQVMLREATEAEPDFSIEQKIIDQEEGAALKEKMQTALNNLTPRQREAIFLRFYEGLSYEEVARIMNITVKATYKIMARSLESLKEKLTLLVVLLLLTMPAMASFKRK